MQPNRLEKVWKFVKPEILKRWDRLTGDDLQACDYQYDLIVEAIRRTYFSGRSHLSLEGDIRDWLNERISFYEEQKNIH
ncbi:MAG: hypothetical protein Q7T03_10820 [Deltaproteobacteria bacterium]|nr:hypothetical protein [Deltaproteobacteria bacterium]